MPLSLIKGTYRVVHSEPDGDSVHFQPHDPQAFTTLHLAAHANHDGGVQLRLDAIDALETHYTPRARGAFLQHQPLGLAHAAADELLRLLRFKTWTRGQHETITASTPDTVEGYILTRFVDKYGRPVALVYSGKTRHRDLAPVTVDTTLLAKSVNYQLTTAGLVYPTFYSQLYPDLRAALTEAATTARTAKAGVWAADTTTSGTTITTLADLTDTAVILPKLFRRLIDYLALGAGSVNLDGFAAFLAARNDRVLVISDGHLTGLDNLITVTGHTVTLTQPPENLSFIEG